MRTWKERSRRREDSTELERYEGEATPRTRASGRKKANDTLKVKALR